MDYYLACNPGGFMKELTVKDLNTLNVSSNGPMLSLYLSKDESILDQKSINERFKINC